MSGECPHEGFTARVDVYRLADEEGGPITAFAADIAINCAICGMPFQFLGCQRGISFRAPTVSVDHCELRVPLRPGPFVT